MRDRFTNYRNLVARFSSVASCGHEVKQGDHIGYNPRCKKAVCAGCWRKWCAENDEADRYERANGCY